MFLTKIDLKKLVFQLSSKFLKSLNLTSFELEGATSLRSFYLINKFKFIIYSIDTSTFTVRLNSYSKIFFNF